jgi:hypothetical protein
MRRYDSNLENAVLASVKDIVAEILHLEDRCVRFAGKRLVEMRLDDLTDDDVVISLLDNGGHPTFDRARRIDQNRAPVAPLRNDCPLSLPSLTSTGRKFFCSLPSSAR